MNETKFFIKASYVGESIDIKKFLSEQKQYNFQNKDTTLIIKIEDDKFFALTKFGAIVSWNVSSEKMKEILVDLSPYIRNRQTSYPYEEQTEAMIGETKEEEVDDGEIKLTDLKLSKIKLVSYVMAQSVALNRYEDDVEQALAEMEKSIQSLKDWGRIFSRPKNILKQIGRVLSIKQVAVAHLSLFDKPEETWESAKLEKLFIKLQQNFELRERFGVLNEKLNFLSENTRMLSDFIGERRMVVLELIIIAFFAIELIPTIRDIVEWILIKK